MYDSVLPQFDENPAQRKVEMDEKRERYGLKGNCEDAPKQVCLFLLKKTYKRCFKDVVDNTY